MKTVVAFGEIMLRLNPPGNERFTRARAFEACYGGGEANVAASLAAFGINTQFVTRLPANDLGEACLGYLKSSNIGVDHILRGGERMGIYFLETGAAQRPSKVLYDRANSSFATLDAGTINWDQVFADAGWFHWTGITPAVSQGAAAACREGILAARKAGVTVSCDLNYRAKLWKWGTTAHEIMTDFVSTCDVAVGNEEDAEKVFGITAPDCDVRAGKVDARNYQAVCESLHQRFPNLQTIAITVRTSISASHNRWTAVLWHNRAFYTGPEYDIEPVVDRVGTGDAFNAGLIYGMNRYPQDPPSALAFAISASCLKHSIPGDFNRVTVGEVEQLMVGDGSGRISR